MSEAPDSRPDALRSRVVSGVAWKVASQLILQGSRLVVALILARMLTPHDWGLAAMTLVFSGFVVVFTDNALGTALIQRRVLTDRDRSTVFWTSAAIGVLLAAAGVALSGALASFYGEPEVQPLFAVLALSFCATGLGTTQGALLVRDMRFRSLESRQIVATLAGAAVGISVAVAGGGPWAIVAQYVTDAALFSALLWYRTSWYPSFSFSWASLRNLSGFAGNVFAENLLYQAGRNLGQPPDRPRSRRRSARRVRDRVERDPGPVLAHRGTAPQVFFPAFSSMQDDRERMAAVWIRVSRLVGALSFPALVGLVIVADDFVSVVLGDRWEETAQVIQILAWAGLIQSLQTLNGEILLALGRAGTLLRFTMLWFAGTVVAFAVGVQFGVLGVAAYTPSSSS